MFNALKHRIRIEEKQTTSGPLGPTIKWVTLGERWGGFVELSVEGRAQFGQIGHSSVAGKLIFRGPLDFDLSMAKHRFSYKGKYYEAVEPPSNPDTVNRLVSIVVRKLPQQP